MRIGFYSRLAVDGIRKNKKLYLPYLITSILMMSIFYIIYYLAKSESLASMRGGSTFQPLLFMGVIVIGLFSTIFLFYTNSFLIKRRKKEFGLYNILGMDKHGISKVLFWETVVIFSITTVIGCIVGVLFSKFFELGFVNLINGVVDFNYSINWSGIIGAIVLFSGIELLIFLNSVRQVRFSNVIDLVKSASVGEKAPKANWAMGLIGLAVLSVAYYMAVTIENPIEAFSYFFFAVLLVIVATYILMVSGSVVICKILQKNKNYYYKKSHFVSVSSMMYRMKRNGAGLASICILLTMILVTISSTTCLFFGNESSLQARYPREIIVSSYFNTGEDMKALAEDNYLRDEIEKYAQEAGAKTIDLWDYTTASTTGMLSGDGLVQIFPEAGDSADYSSMVSIHFLELEDYNKVTGKNLTLNPGEAYASRVKGKNNLSRIAIKETGDEIVIKDYIEPATREQSSMVDVISDITLVVDDMCETLKNLQNVSYTSESGRAVTGVSFEWIYGFNTGLDVDGQLALKSKIYDFMHVVCATEECSVERFYVDSVEEQREDFYQTFAGFLFLGLTLSGVFLVGTILIIYYKQITEGYEDQPRFIIMQKVGMTKKDIKKSINSQMLTVFFLPLIFAALHMAFALPMISKLLLFFGLVDTRLFIITTALTVLVCGVIYAIVYKITSSIYYSLVSSANAE